MNRILDAAFFYFKLQLYNELRHQYGLDLPWYAQYWNFLTNLAHGNFGYILQKSGRTGLEDLAEGAPISAQLGFWALVIQIAVGVPLGIYSALKANTWIDTTNMGVMLILFSIPLLCAGRVLPGFHRLDGSKNTGGSWPVAGWGNKLASTPDLIFSSKVGPILVLSAVGMAYDAALSCTSMLEVLRQDYVRTARAKGMREQVVVYRHALRNALIPLVTVIGLSFGLIVTGAFFIEFSSNIPGYRGRFRSPPSLTGTIPSFRPPSCCGRRSGAGQPVIGTSSIRW